MGIARRKAGTTVACTRCAQSVQVPTSDQAGPVPRPRVPPVVPSGGGGQEREREREREHDRDREMDLDVPLFDRPDFEQQLEEDDDDNAEPLPFEGPALSVLGARVPPPVPTPGAPGGPVEYDVERVDPATMAPAGGFILTSTQATLLTLAAILMMVLAFGAGLLVGKYYL
jgi:hypothetical protein